MDKQLINITDWNEYEVRIEICGNGNYILKEDVGKWIRENAELIAMEVAYNLTEKAYA